MDKWLWHLLATVILILLFLVVLLVTGTIKPGVIEPVMGAAGR
jgi:hypothetical protein